MYIEDKYEYRMQIEIWDMDTYMEYKYIHTKYAKNTYENPTNISHIDGWLHCS